MEQSFEKVFAFMWEERKAVIYKENEYTSLYMTLAMKIRHDFQDWTSRWAILCGQQLEDAKPKHYEHVIQREELFNDTIFEEEPSNLYSLAKVNLVELDNKLHYAQLILMIPLVRPSNTKVWIFLGHSRSVYMWEENSLVLYIKDKRNFYHLICKDAGYVMTSVLYVCPAENFSNKTASVQEHAVN